MPNKRVSDEELLELLDAIDDAEEADEPAPLRAAAERLGLTYGTAASRKVLARERGLLPLLTAAARPLGHVPRTARWNQARGNSQRYWLACANCLMPWPCPTYEQEHSS